MIQPDPNVSEVRFDNLAEVEVAEGSEITDADGNLGIAGHRDGFFRGLRHLEVGDSLRLTSLEGVAHYEVVELSVVSPADVEVLAPTAEPTLTLASGWTGDTATTSPAPGPAVNE